MTVWHEAMKIPPVSVGDMHEYVLAVLRNRTGKVYSFAATYLNAYPLEYRDGCPFENERGKGCGKECDDGCPTTGWFEQTGSDDYASLFNSLELRDGDKIVGWAEIPQWADDHPVQMTAAD